MIRWLPILMYHRVADVSPEDDPHQIAVSPEMLRAHLERLRRAGYRTVSLEEAVALRRRPGRKEVILTFDDGYADFSQNALPLLREYDCGATVFMVSDDIGLTNLWDEPAGAGSPRAVPLMSKGEILDAARWGVEIGSHGATHRRLTALSDANEIRREIHGSRRTLEDIVRQPVHFFCYPYTSTGESIERAVQEAGYAGACAGDRPWHRPFHLSRIDAVGLGPETLLWALSVWRWRLKRLRLLRHPHRWALHASGKLWSHPSQWPVRRVG